MIRIIKMDLYRLLKTKSAWIMLVLGVIFTVFSTAMIKVDINDMKKDENYYQLSMQEENISHYSNDPGDTIYASIGFMVNTNTQWINDEYKISVWEMLNINAASRIFILFIGISAAIFVRAEQKNGYIKGIAGLLPSRGGFALSKFITTAIYTIAYFAVNLVFTAVSSKLVFGYVNFGGIKEFVPTALTLLLLHVTFAAIITSICIFTNSSGMGVFVSTALGAGFAELLYSMINFALKHLCGVVKGFNIMRYTVSCNIAMMSENLGQSDFTRACIVASVYLIIFMAIGIIVMKKRDVK